MINPMMGAMNPMFGGYTQMPQPNSMNPLQMFGQQGGGFTQALQRLKANPMEMIMQRRFNVPPNISGDPNAIIQHLLSTGQITQDQVNAAYSFIQRSGW